MGAFPALPLGRRPVLGRCLAVYRARPEFARALLPRELTPELLQGHAVITVCYTHLGGPPLFRGPTRGSDHLAYRIAAHRPDGDRATWIARRETSSWLEARCGRRLLRGEYGRAAFRRTEDAFALELAVEGERGEEFYLRGETAAGFRGSLFGSAQALEDFLQADHPPRPYDLFAPEADVLSFADSAAEPLTVFEWRCAVLGTAELDSAWRLVTRRLQASPARRPAFRVLPEPGSPASVLPT